MKVLFILGKYYPVPSPNGICAKRIMEELSHSGDEPICLCCNHGEEKAYEELDAIPVHRALCGFYSRVMHVWRLLPRWRGGLLRVTAGIWQGLVNLFCLFHWPFCDPALYRHYLKEGKRLCRDEGVKAIFAINDPLESVAAGAALKKQFPNIRLTICYIDALSGGNRLRQLRESRRTLFYYWASWCARKWEYRLGKNADTVIVMEAARSHYDRLWKDVSFYSKTIYLNVPYFNPSLLKTVYCVKNRSKINILFCGNLYGLRDPSYILALAERLDRPDVVWHFVGGRKKMYDKLFEHAKAKLGDRLILTPFLPHEELKPLIRSSDVLLNIGERLPSVVAGKLFEYISYGKPILSTFPIRDNSGIPILEKYPNALLLYDDTPLEESAVCLEQFLANNLDLPIDCEELIHCYGNASPEAYLRVIR